MAAEELKTPAGAPKPAAPQSAESNVGNGDMANLIGNMGILIDSTIESVQGMISSVSSATGQLIEGVTSTINSDSVQGMITSVSNATGQLIDGVTSTINSEPVKEIIQNVNSVSGQLLDGVNSVSGQLLDGVTATLNSEQVQSSFQEFGKMWKNLLENLNSTVSSGQVQNLFNNVSSGLGQLMGNVMAQGRPFGSEDRQRKSITEIPFSPKESVSEIKITPPVQKAIN